MFVKITTRLLIGCLFAYPSLGAISHDVSTNDFSSVTTTTCDFPHAAGGSPTLALLAIGLDGVETITGTPTYGGTNMVFVGEADASCTASGDQRIHLYELHITTETGTQQAIAIFTQDDHHFCVAQTWNGTHTTNATAQFIGESAACQSSCTAPATTLVLASAASYMVTFGIFQGADRDPVDNTSYTERSEGQTGTSNSSDDVWVYGESTGDSGSLTHTSTPKLADECAQLSVELVEPSGAAAPARRRAQTIGGRR